MNVDATRKSRALIAGGVVAFTAGAVFVFLDFDEHARGVGVLGLVTGVVVVFAGLHLRQKANVPPALPRRQRSHLRLVLISFSIAYFTAPALMWNRLARFNQDSLIIFIVLSVIVYVLVFGLICLTYQKIPKDNQGERKPE